MNPSTRWYYFLPGGVYALGPTTHRFRTERQARAHIRKVWGVRRLPNGTNLWRE